MDKEMTYVKEAFAEFRSLVTEAEWTDDDGTVVGGCVCTPYDVAKPVIDHLEELLSATHDVLYKTSVENVDGEDCWRTQRLRNAYKSFGGDK